MFSMKALGSMVLGAAMFVAAGCQSAGANQAAATQPAVACDKCKVTLVSAPTKNDKGRIIAYHQEKQMTCPDCKNALTSLIEKGKFEHTCAACGGNMSQCDMH